MKLCRCKFTCQSQFCPVVALNRNSALLLARPTWMKQLQQRERLKPLLSAIVLILSSDRQEHNIHIKVWFSESETGYQAFLLFIYFYFFTETQQSVSFCYKMKTQAVFQAQRKAVITNLLDVSGSVGCVPCCLSLLTHHLHSCLLEALQSLFLSSCQALLQFYMSLDKIEHWHQKDIKIKALIPSIWKARK